MPHTKEGEVVRVGDVVYVKCLVKDVYQTEGDGYCNCTLETEEPMFPTENRSTFTLNTRQVTKNV